MQSLALPSLLSLILSMASGSLLAEHSITLNSSLKRSALVELYTSEGCSSCPPAETWLQQLIQTPQHELDTLVLEFHVDYWDYIGWKDRFGDPAYTTRQRELARKNQQRTIYTPEFFVDGNEARGTQHVVQLIQSSNSEHSPARLELTVTPTKQQFALQLRSQIPALSDYQIRFVVFENNLTSAIKRGENGGRQLQHQRVVRYFSPLLAAAPELRHVIPVNTDWNLQNLGVAALLSNTRGDYIQSVSGPVTFDLSIH